MELPLGIGSSLCRAAIAGGAAVVFATATFAADRERDPVERSPISIETLLGDGWQIAGYTGTFDVRAALLLFKHPSKNYLVQCSTIYDVTRNPRTVVNCYELH